ncbi:MULTISPECIES: DNA adenine methylase [Lysinibacillus]|jgi:DNA adenine methylase|uniref:DNA adenine methylase n=1 Tax=Lysinibacillus TaxID=400634 RepID=UPI0004D81328|nr:MULTISPECIES: DNA adenine methylase [Lysinibacillus]AJK87652.1 DNA methyltransferase [Lysinibacillus fusiformis]KHK48782.1 DNA methyltransferase [Lysinibacillus sp. A1]
MANPSPLRYPGGKNKTYRYVQYLIKENNLTTYIEPFAGGAAVALRLLLNNDVQRIIINDYDRSIYALWNTIVTNHEALINLIENTEITIEEWYRQREVQLNKDTAYELDLAFSTLFLNRTNRSGIIKAGVIGGKDQQGDYKLDCRFNKVTIIKRIKAIATRANDIKVYNEDAKHFISKVIKHTRNSLTFFDPPYYVKGPDLYTNFYEHDDHVELAKNIKKLMRNRYWILTYDIAEQVEKMYKNYKPHQYCLNYSIAKPNKGEEFIFFSKKVDPKDISLYLKTL